MEKQNEMERARGCQRTTSSPICLLVNRRALQFFFFWAITFVLSAALLRGALSSGTTYSLSFVDIDGNKLSTADGHVTVLVATTTADWEKAREVGDRVPHYCLGNPNYRMVTIIRFTRKHGPIVRTMRWPW